jgi:hypothetical protein
MKCLSDDIPQENLLYNILMDYLKSKQTKVVIKRVKATKLFTKKSAKLKNKV